MNVPSTSPVLPAEMPAVRAARPHELELAITMLEDAAAWLSAAGIAQWPAGSQRAQSSHLHDCLKAGDLFFLTLGDQPVGTVILRNALPRYWPTVSRSGGYIAKLCVGRQHAGHGLGLWLLRWAEREVAGRRLNLARLDCWAGNPRLCEYYVAAGYSREGTSLAGRWEMALFEKELCR
jgi:GNAT superfamily N-acetyltransferase